MKKLFKTSTYGYTKSEIIVGVVAAMIAIIFTGFVLWSTLFGSASAAEPDTAPIFVTQERMLDNGEIEFFGTYTNNVYNGGSDNNVYQFGGLYAPRDWLTVGATVSEGDIVALATTKVGNVLGMQIRPSIGLSYPVGYDTVSAFGTVGDSSGTIDLTPALSLMGEYGRFDLGTQWMGTFRLNDNDDGFTYGDVNRLAAWASVDVRDNVSVYVAGKYTNTGAIDNLPTFLTTIGSTESETLQAGVGTRVELYGFDVKGEFFIPVSEDFNTANQFNEVRQFSLSVQRLFQSYYLVLSRTLIMEGFGVSFLPLNARLQSLPF